MSLRTVWTHHDAIHRLRALEETWTAACGCFGTGEVLYGRCAVHDDRVEEYEDVCICGHVADIHDTACYAATDCGCERYRPV